MDVGVFTFATDRDMGPAELALEVEQRDFSSLMFTEHSHIPIAQDTPYPLAYGGGVMPDFYKRTYDPFVACAFAASSTTRIRIGTAVCLLALRDPVHTAKEVASVDRLSGGRFDFGVGFGWNVDEFASHGADFSRRHAVVRERVAMLRTLWTQDEASFDGDFHHLEPSWVYPKPLQPAGPPVLLGGNGPLSMKHAAKWADGWFPTGPLKDPTLKHTLPEFKRMVAEAGRDPSTVSVGVAPGHVDRDTMAAYTDNGLDFVTVSVVAGSRDEMLRNLDTLAAIRDSV